MQVNNYAYRCRRPASRAIRLTGDGSAPFELVSTVPLCPIQGQWRAKTQCARIVGAAQPSRSPSMRFSSSICGIEIVE